MVNDGRPEILYKSKTFLSKCGHYERKRKLESKVGAFKKRERVKRLRLCVPSEFDVNFRRYASEESRSLI